MNPGDCAACSTLGVCSDHRDEARGEQGPTREEREIDRLRADVRHLREAMQSIAFRTTDPIAAKIATDTLGRVMT